MTEKIYIYDESTLVISGLKYFLENQGSIIAGATSKSQELFETLLSGSITLAIIDPSFLKGKEISRLAEIKNKDKKLKIIFYSSSHAMRVILSHYKIKKAIYISKEHQVEKLIHAVLSFPGNYTSIITPFIEAKINNENSCVLIQKLTDREFQVLREIGAGKTNKCISEEMGLNKKTVSTYKRNIMKKLGTNNVRDVVDFARLNGF